MPTTSTDRLILINMKCMSCSFHKRQKLEGHQVRKKGQADSDGERNVRMQRKSGRVRQPEQHFERHS